MLVTAILVVFASMSALVSRDHETDAASLSAKLPIACIPTTDLTRETHRSEADAEDYKRAAASEIVLVDGELIEVFPGDLRFRSPEDRGIAKPTRSFETLCTSWRSLSFNMVGALAFMLIIAMLGLALRWVYRGFRENSV